MPKEESAKSIIYIAGGGGKLAPSCKALLSGAQALLSVVDDLSDIPLPNGIQPPDSFIVMDSLLLKKKQRETRWKEGAVITVGPKPDFEILNVPDEKSLRGILPAMVGVWLENRRLDAEQSQLKEKLRQADNSLTQVTTKMKFYERKSAFVEKQRAILSTDIDRMRIVTTLSREIMSKLDLDEIAGLITQRVPLIVNACWVSFYLYDYDLNRLVLSRTNHKRKINNYVDLAANADTPMVVALREGQLRIIKDLRDFALNKGIMLNLQYSTEYKSASCIIIPLIVGDRIIGVLNLSDKTDGNSFDEVHDLPPLEQLTPALSSALHNCLLHREVLQQSKTDSMTHFLNHRTFYEELQREINAAQRYHSPLSLVIYDIDHFKNINDVHGHQAGDHVIRTVADIIVQSIRGSDIPARYGGDEFCVILSRTDLDHAMIAAERILEKVRATEITFDSQRIKATLSGGIAQYRGQPSAEEFVRQVDDALYQAKQNGRDRIERYEGAHGQDVAKTRTEEPKKTDDGHDAG